MIVGQGQLDEVLHAGPDARRALIEEAAGVLKHRKRKEKALRKLEAMQANLTRLVDLTAELGRRLKPLGRQAEIARKAAVIQADLRDARLRLLADDYVTLAAELEKETAGEALVAARRAELEAGLGRARAKEAELEAAAREHVPRLTAAQETWFALSSLAERLRGVASLAAERHRHLSAEPEPAGPGRDPDALDAEAAMLREEEAALGERLAACRDRLAEAVQARTAAEDALAEVERQRTSHAREAAARAERLARLRGQVGAARSRGLAAEEEIARLADAREQAAERAGHAEQEHAESRTRRPGARRAGRSWPPPASRPPSRSTARPKRVTALRAAEHEASAERAALRARKEALEEACTAAATPRASCSASRAGSAACWARSPPCSPWTKAGSRRSPPPSARRPTRWPWRAWTRPWRFSARCAVRRRQRRPGHRGAARRRRRQGRPAAGRGRHQPARAGRGPRSTWSMPPRKRPRRWPGCSATWW